MTCDCHLVRARTLSTADPEESRILPAERRPVDVRVGGLEGRRSARRIPLTQRETKGAAVALWTLAHDHATHDPARRRTGEAVVPTVGTTLRARARASQRTRSLKDRPPRTCRREANEAKGVQGSQQLSRKDRQRLRAANEDPSTWQGGHRGRSDTESPRGRGGVVTDIAVVEVTDHAPLGAIRRTQGGVRALSSCRRHRPRLLLDRQHEEGCA